METSEFLPKTEAILLPVKSNPLPAVETGSIVGFNNTLASSGEFDLLTMIKIAQIRNLDPVEDYKKILDLLKDPNESEAARKQVANESGEKFKVTGIYAAPKVDIVPKDDGFYPDFFKPNHNDQGIHQVTPSEISKVEYGYIGGGQNTSAFKNMLSDGVYGDSQKYPTYFSTDYELAMSHLPDEDGAPVLLEVDTSKLLKYRSVYRDPESLSIGSESGKTFIVFHGVPNEAIKRIITLENIEK